MVDTPHSQSSGDRRSPEEKEMEKLLAGFSEFLDKKGVVAIVATTPSTDAAVPDGAVPVHPADEKYLSMVLDECSAGCRRNTFRAAYRRLRADPRVRLQRRAASAARRVSSGRL